MLKCWCGRPGGWVERKEGYGWRFLPVANAPEAFDEIYRFRMAMEPAALLEPSFELDRSTLTEQRRIQEGILNMEAAASTYWVDGRRRLEARRRRGSIPKTGQGIGR